MSKTKSGGKVTQHKQSQRHGKRLGLKKFGGEQVISGNIILKQRGAKYKAGQGVGMGRDHTIYALQTGIVGFGKRFGRTIVNVLSQ